MTLSIQSLGFDDIITLRWNLVDFLREKQHRNWFFAIFKRFCEISENSLEDKKKSIYEKEFPSDFHSVKSEGLNNNASQCGFILSDDDFTFPSPLGIFVARSIMRGRNCDDYRKLSSLWLHTLTSVSAAHRNAICRCNSLID